MNSKQQGAIGVAIAIAHYTKLGYAVFVPVSDVSRYDLILDNGSGPLRLEVKTTSQANGLVHLATRGGNQSWSGEVKRITKENCDLVFCYNINSGSFKEFTSDELDGRSTVTLH